MSKYELIHDLCESRIFRSKQAMEKYDANDANTLLYSILLSTIALALNPKTHSWAKSYASKSGAFGNFDFFRPTATDLYVLTHMALHVNGSISKGGATSILRLYKELGKGNVDSNFAEQTLLRLERGLRVRDARLKNARRVLTHWSNSSPDDQRQTVANLYRNVRTYAKLAEVLPYLQSAQAGEPGHFGKMSPGKFAAAAAGVGLAGLALGYHSFDRGSRWGILKNSEDFDGDGLLKEDRATQLFEIVKGLRQHPNIEKIIKVNYIADGISVFVRTTDGNAYELEIRPARFAKGHAEKRGVTESTIEDFDDGDQTDMPCKECGKGTYVETSIFDDMDGVLHCSNCGTPTDRYLPENAGGCWEYMIAERNDAAIVGNDAAKIARTAKQAEETFIKADKGGDGVKGHDNVQHHLAHIRAMYGVEIVDDFMDVLELPNAENDTDKQQSLFSKDNR